MTADLPSAPALSTLIDILWHTRAFVDSEGKVFLWRLVVYLLRFEPRFDALLSDLAFLSDDVRQWVTPYGIVAYTSAHGQITANLLLPYDRGQHQLLLDAFVTHVAATHAGHALNLTPLCGQTPSDLDMVCRRRFVSLRSQIPSVTYDAECACVRNFGLTHMIEHELSDASEVARYRPLSTMRDDDPEDTVYWHRAPCGTLVALRNPWMDPVPTIRIDRFVSQTVVCRVENDEARHLLLKLLGQDPDMCKELVLRCAWIPNALRMYYVAVVAETWGIDDAFAYDVSERLRHVARKSMLVRDLCEVGLWIKQWRWAVSKCGASRPPVALSDNMMENVRKWTTPVPGETPEGSRMWQRWSLTSPFVAQCADVCSMPAWKSHMGRSPQLRRTAVRLLVASVGQWAARDYAKAEWLLAHDEDEDGVLVCEVERAWAMRDVQMEALTASETSAAVVASPRTAGKKARRRAAHKARVREIAPPPTAADAAAATRWTADESPPATHAPLVARMQAWLGWPCALIGSGVFSDRSDADVIITVREADDIAGAYARVAARSGWTPRYEHVTGERVVTLAGIFEGVCVDAQVWRGEGTTALTPAEEDTHRALRLTRQLVDGSDARLRRHVRALHEWAHAAGAKGHRWCRLSGIAVTCVAVSLASRAPADCALAWLLRQLRATLARSDPTVRLGCDDATSCARDAADVPQLPLAIHVEHGHLVSRMTVGTTRHLLELVVHSSCTADARLTDAAWYDTWRARHMLVAARMTPLVPTAVVATLHAIAAELDGHPVLQTVYFAEEEEEGGERASTAVRVLVTLDAAADVNVYGFRVDDVLDAGEDGGHVRVVRGDRTWPLCTTASHGRSLTARERACTLTDLVAVDANRCVANAPYLTVDVVARFDARQWCASYKT
jgi:hypothetical protein